MTTESQFVVPTYIDTNALLDLLASIEGGFSFVEKITSRTSEAKTSEKGISLDAGTEFGIPNILSLLRLSLQGSLGTKKAKEVADQREVERYHTYGSLLHRLRSFLYEESLLKFLTDDTVWESINPSDFVEIHGLIRPNPLTDSLQRLDRLIAIIQLVGPTAYGAGSAKSKAQSDMKQIKQIKDFFAGILKDIETERVRKFVVDVKGLPGCKAVVLLFMDYLRDKSMSEVAFKEYRLLGKVVRKLDKTSESSINLLIGTGLGGIGREALSQLLVAFNQVEGMSLPEIKTEIPGPALEVVPIALYV